MKLAPNKAHDHWQVSRKLHHFHESNMYTDRFRCVSRHHDWEIFSGINKKGSLALVEAHRLISAYNSMCGQIDPPQEFE